MSNNGPLHDKPFYPAKTAQILVAWSRFSRLAQALLRKE